ncbi:MAG: hypothetical protein KAW12_14075 [Candidatus Aminicenantes bacterium]|nr:hypothetical protein [Candidatus Aminicenantes bacterium]
MTKFIKKSVILTLVLTTVIMFLTAAAVPAQHEKAKENPKIPTAVDNNTQEETQVPPPPFSEDIFPCSECHADMEPNPQRRVLEDAHDDIILKHDEQNRWCLDCHDKNNRDVLHLADGRPVDFKESYKLCGQCHGPKLRDWRRGVHGRRTGSWNGPKKYLLCAHCHNPHSPRFKKLKPEPPPKRPGGNK